ncbi:MAG: hypothetical protein WCS03_16010 [Bacteroidota bacterium]
MKTKFEEGIELINHYCISSALLDNEKRVNRLLESSMMEVVMKIVFDHLNDRRKVSFLVGYNKPYEFFKKVYLEKDDYILKDQDIIMVELKTALNIQEKLYQRYNLRRQTS